MYPILGKKRKTNSQVETLTKSFEANAYPGEEDKHQLAKLLNISKRQVDQWFCNRRSKKLRDTMPNKSE